MGILKSKRMRLIARAIGVLLLVLIILRLPALLNLRGWVWLDLRVWVEAHSTELNVLTLIFGFFQVLSWWEQLKTRLIEQREERRREEQRRTGEALAQMAKFPFKWVSPEELSEHLIPLEFRGIRYVPRCAPERQRRIEAWADEKRLLIRGRMGLGKTMELVQTVRRMEERRPGRVFVLLPDGYMDVPREPPDDFDQWARQSTVVLVLDNLDFEYRKGEERRRELAAAEVGFHQRFQAIVDYFEEHCDDFRVVAAVRSERKHWDRIGYSKGDPFWRTFELRDLPSLEREMFPGFIAALEEWLGIEVEPEAAEFIGWKFDGTLAAVRDPPHAPEGEGQREGCPGRCARVHLDLPQRLGEGGL